jgi:glycosyltransferase involved in cell wall biosynthesis
MHIVFITHEYPLPGRSHGGIGTYVGIISKALTELGIKVTVVGTGDGFSTIKHVDDKVVIYQTPQFNKVPVLGNFFNRWAIAMKIKQLHKENPVAVVEAPEMGLAFMPKWKGITYLIRMNGGHHFFAAAEERPTSWWRAFQEKQSFKKADALCAVSYYVAEKTRALLKLGNVDIPVIPNPVDTTKFYEGEEGKIQPQEVLFVGSVCKKKGVEELVAAMSLVWQHYPHAYLRIVGRDVWDERFGGSFVTYLKSKISSQANVIFEGAVPHALLPKFIEKAAICAYPSYMEALPLAWLEALAMGKAFIGSNTGPGPEVVKHGVSGLLVNPRKPQEIAEAILSLLDHPEMARRLGKNARKNMVEKFNAKRLALINQEYFNSIKKQA